MIIANFRLDRKEVRPTVQSMIRIRMKDSTFRFDIIRDKSGVYWLRIYGLDRDDVVRRATWIRYNVFMGGKFYRITEGGESLWQYTIE